MAAPSGSEVWRDYVTNGIPSSGANNPKKSDIRSWASWLESLVTSGVLSSGPWFATKAVMTLGYAANTIAVVYNDPTAANNGLYIKSGASGSGSWTQLTSFLPGYQFVTASPTGESTPNAIVTVTSPRLPAGDGVALVTLVIPATNTASPVTVRFDGGAALSIKTRTGENPDAGELQQNDVVAGFVSGSTFRLISDLNSLRNFQSAKAWANNDEDVPVPADLGGDGLTTFSAKHWAAKSNDDADRSEVAREGSEAARNIAAGYASDAVSQGNVPIYATVVGMPSLEISAGINAIRVNGYHAAGDGGGALYVKVGSEPAHAGKFQTADGAWWELAEGQKLNIEAFGVVAGLGVSDPVKAANAAALQDANDFMEARGGGEVFAPAQFYLFREGYLRLSTASGFIGRGTDEWEPVFPQRPKKWNGTNFIFCGTGPRDVSFYGLTSMKYAGGWRENPDSAGTHFKLTSFANADAVGSTPATLRQFSVAVCNKPGAHSITWRGIRIVNSNGVDHIAGHSDQASTSLGDEWDIGFALINCEYADIEDIQVVGNWREFAFLDITTVDIESRSERNSIRRYKFQGRVGLGIRGADRWDVDATTANSVQIYFSEESYWPSAGSFRGSNNVTYTYTGTTKFGTALTFTGVTPDPTGIFQIRHTGAGFANTSFENGISYGLDHVSGSVATVLGVMDSKPMEVSGYPLRGVKFHNAKFHTREKVVAHLHDAQDLKFIDPQFEGGGHMIASPVNTDATYVQAAVGETRNLVMIADDGLEDQDLRLFLPRNGFIQGLQLGLRSDLSGNTRLEALRAGKDLVLRAKAGREVRLEKSDGNLGMRMTDTGNVIVENGGQFSLLGGVARVNWSAGQAFTLREGTTIAVQIDPTSRNVRPGSDNVQSLGSGGFRWSTVFAGTGTINTSDAREKTDLRPLSDAEKRAFRRVLDGVGVFRFLDALSQKGDDQARYHIGVTVQNVIAAFEAEGLDPWIYAPICKDYLEDDPSRYRLGLRATELMWGVLASLER